VRAVSPRLSGFSSKATLWTALALVCLAAVQRTVAAEPVEWLTGEALRARLAQPENVFWQDAPLRRTLEKFCRAQRVAVLIDRRIDPDQRIDGGVSGVPIGGILVQIAESRGLGVSFFGPLVYLGPSELTAKLRTLAELRRQDVCRLPAAEAERFARAEPLAWDDIASPRELLENLAYQSGVEIAGLQRIPHDLWAAADLPELPLVDRITLVAGQFDLTFTISPDGRRVTLVPLPDEVAIVRDYPAGRNPQELVDRWQAVAPGCQVKLSGSKIYVKGLLEEIDEIEGKARPGPGSSAPSSVPSGGETRFSGRVANKPLGDVLDYVGSQMGLDMDIDRQALARSGVSLDQLVSFSVKDATVDELLEAVLEPAGCSFRRRGNSIEIRPTE